MGDRYPCPCCGYLVFGEPPGSFDICPICFWEDDWVQLGFPNMAGGANRVNLIDAQAGFVRDGVSERRFAAHVRPPSPADDRDAGWRPLDPTADPHLRDESDDDHRRWQSRPRDACLYWWRPEYWLRDDR